MNQHLAVELIICYLTLSFIYSIVEKLRDWKDTKNYYKDHFKGSFISKHVPAAITAVIVLEIVSVGLNIAGVSLLLFNKNTAIALWGFLSVSVTLIVLMTGQRIAQDYSGAMNITVYFILTVLGLFMLEIL